MTHKMRGFIFYLTVSACWTVQRNTYIRCLSGLQRSHLPVERGDRSIMCGALALGGIECGRMRLLPNLTIYLIRI
jgi:hypothetical protein